MQSIYKFAPVLKSVIWGGDKIVKMMGLDFAVDCIGESWELSAVPCRETWVVGGADEGLTISQLIAKYGERLLGVKSVRKYGLEMPLLVKLIDARQNLSLQVHPDEEMARREHGCHGKAEMWYVMQADDDAQIYAGLNRKLSPAEFAEHVADGTVMDFVAASDSEPGAYYFIPPGRLHAIGGGNLLIEIQQSSDVTYRVYDYGRGRELHIDKAMEAIDFDTVIDDCRSRYDESADETQLVGCEWFEVKRELVDGERKLALDADSFSILVCASGECDVKVEEAQLLPDNESQHGEVSAVKMRPGDTILIPASHESASLTGQATLLLSQIP